MYYINKYGKKVNSIDFINPYICITCGTLFKFDSNKVKELLSKNISYRVNLIERSIVELHLENFFSTSGKLTIRNKISKQSLEEFFSEIT